MEGGSTSGFRFHPDFTSLFLNNLLYNSQPYTGTLKFIAGVDSLENNKHLFVKTWINSRSVVADAELIKWT